MTTPTTYELVLRGRASARLLRPLLGDFAVDRSAAGVTRLVGPVLDASHLNGVLTHLTSVGVELVSLGPVPCASPRTCVSDTEPTTTPGAEA